MPNSHAQKTHSKDKNDWLLKGNPHDPTYIKDVLELARELRICLHVGSGDISSLPSVCVALNRQYFAVYLQDAEWPLPPTGEIQVYFTLHSDGETLPCNFSTSIIKLRDMPGGQAIILAMPDVIKHEQRRMNVRASVGKERIPGFKVHHGSPADNGSGKPGLHWTPLNGEDFDLVDLSAGGLQLDVRDTCQAYSQLSSKELLLISGNFALPGKPPLPLSMVARIVRVKVLEEQKTKSLGVRFQRWRNTRIDRNAWHKIDEEVGVPALCPWVFHILRENTRLTKK